MTNDQRCRAEQLMGELQLIASAVGRSLHGHEGQANHFSSVIGH
jgi:hypothetical protein